MKPSQGGVRQLLTITVLLAAGLGGSSEAAADSEAVARRHAAKANQLAAKNRCTSAIFEFTRALETLKDPSLFFNRAECFRKVGRDDEAITDYERFLAEMPDAPNRAAVRARIAALRGTARATPKPEATPVVSKEPPAVPEKAPATPVAKLPDKATAASVMEPPAPVAKPADQPAVAAPPAPAGKPAGKPMGPPAKEPSPAAKPTEKAPAAPVRRAEKWTD
jgi:outer membrane biosynthesis protein TonB